MQVDLKEPFQKLKAVFRHPIMEELIKSGFTLTLVGGTVRDWLATKSLSTDLDIEYHLSKKSELLDYYGHIQKLLKLHKIEYECLRFEIIRFEIGEFEIELSPQRKEKYIGKGPFSHQDFEVKTFISLSHDLSFSRRDLTVNAIGFTISNESFDEFKLVDPYGGVEDLQNKVLLHCAKEFFNDPVRFLRLIRFQLKTGFVFSMLLQNKLALFDLSLCSDHYLLQEFKKSKSCFFLERLFELAKQYDITLPEHWSCLDQEDFRCLDFQKLQSSYFYYWIKNSKNSEMLGNFQKLFKLKTNIFKSFSRISSALDQLPQDILSVDASLESEEFLISLDLILKKWEFIEKMNISEFYSDRDWNQIREIQIERSRTKSSAVELDSVSRDKRWTVLLKLTLDRIRQKRI